MWQYADWESQNTNIDRLARLRQHIDEVHALIDANAATAAGSVDFTVLIRYLEYLQTRRRELEARVSTVDRDDPRVRSGFTRARMI